MVRVACCRNSMRLRLLLVYGLLRPSVARGLRDGRCTFGIEFAKAFWSVL